MTPRKAVIATTSFVSQAGLDRIGKHPAVNFGGAISQGARLWSDDPIVVANPTYFVDASILPGADELPASSADAPTDLWSKPEWVAIVRAYRLCGARPKQSVVAAKLGWDTEQPMRDRLRALGIPS